MSAESSDAAAVLAAAAFAADRHRHQKRKGEEASPYINHPLAVANVLAGVGGVTDIEVLTAALLHDTVDHTQTTPEELEALFGADVRRLVDEVSDDKSLPKAKRKLLQIEHSRLVLARRYEYLDWAESAILGCRGVNPALEAYFDTLVAEGREKLRQLDCAD